LWEEEQEFLDGLKSKRRQSVVTQRERPSQFQPRAFCKTKTQAEVPVHIPIRESDEEEESEGLDLQLDESELGEGNLKSQTEVNNSDVNEEPELFGDEQAADDVVEVEDPQSHYFDFGNNNVENEEPLQQQNENPIQIQEEEEEPNPVDNPSPNKGAPAALQPQGQAINVAPPALDSSSDLDNIFNELELPDFPSSDSSMHDGDQPNISRVVVHSQVSMFSTSTAASQVIQPITTITSDEEEGLTPSQQRSIKRRKAFRDRLDRFTKKPKGD
jgi:hypothetical protein